MRPTLTHIALHVQDVDASVAFYRDVCGMGVTHERPSQTGDGKVVWLAEPGRGADMVFVLISGGKAATPQEGDLSHLGFALPSRAAVDAIARRAEAVGALRWAPRQEPFPVGYYCGVSDPDGHMVEFSYGQPLGPGAPDASAGADVDDGMNPGG